MGWGRHRFTVVCCRSGTPLVTGSCDLDPVSLDSHSRTHGLVKIAHDFIQATWDHKSYIMSRMTTKACK